MNRISEPPYYRYDDPPWVKVIYVGICIAAIVAFFFSRPSPQPEDVRTRLTQCALIEAEAQRCAEHLARLAKDCGDE